MKSRFNEELLLKKKFIIFVFITSVAYLAFSTNLNASVVTLKGHSITSKVKTPYLPIENMLFQIKEKVNSENANYTNLMISKFSHAQISELKIYSVVLQPIKKAPLTSYFLPFLMMTLGYILWKIHKRSMNKNDK